MAHGWSPVTDPAPTNTGYSTIRPRDGDRRLSLAVHRAVWQAFVGPIPSGMTIDHVDRNRSNNNLKNLRLATAVQQRANTVITKQRRDGRPILVWKLDAANEIMKFANSGQAAAHFGADRRALRSVASGKAKRTGNLSARWADIQDAFLDGEIFRTAVMSGCKITVSNFGRLLDAKTGAFASIPRVTRGNAYPTAGSKSILMHQVVAEAWPELIGGQRSSQSDTLDHIDRNVENNNPSNLRWATPVEQAANRSSYLHSDVLAIGVLTNLTSCLAGRRVGRGPFRRPSHAA